MSRISALFALLTLALPAFAAPSSGTTFSISPKSFPDLCIAPSADADGSKLVVTSCDNASSDIAWSLDGQALKNSATDSCADVTHGNAWSGNTMQVWGCYSWNNNQKFTLDGDLITWKGQKLCFDLTDGKGKAGTPVQIWSCGSSNPNQQWTYTEVQEVDGCDATDSTGSAPTTGSGAGAGTGSNTTSDTPSTGETDSDDGLEDCDEGDDESSSADVTTATGATVTGTAGTAAAKISVTAAATISVTAAPTASVTTTPGANSTDGIGGELYAGGTWNSSSTSKKHKHKSSTTYGSSEIATDSAGASATESTWGTASTTATGSAVTASATGTATTSSSGLLQVSGTKVVDSDGKTVVLRGTNLGGWLVMEDWMCGITDNSGSADRFAQTTLEKRFGEDQTRELLNVWYDNWLVASDWDKIASLGFNVVRLPFGFRNLLHKDGSWIKDSSGNIDFSRLDWAVAQAKSRGIYVIPVFHIWDGQEAGYSTISEDSWEGKKQRDAAGEIWKKVAAHWLGETTIAAYDAINEPTGSANDNLQRDLYAAIRSVDPHRIIIMESIGTNPSQYGWTNVMYSLHQYLMMGGDEGYSKQQWSGAANDIKQWLGYNIPVYVGEFMADGGTLSWMLGKINNDNLWWSGWTYKTVNMDRWGLFNTWGFNVNVGSDSFDSIKNTWSNMGGLKEQGVASQYKSAASSWKRSEIVMGSPRVGETKRYTGGGHKGRSRRAVFHGGSTRF